MIIFHNQHKSNHISMVFYIAVIIFHNQHESNHISMIFYFAVIIYDSIIISLTCCFLKIGHDALCYRHTQTLIFYFLFLFFYFLFLKIYKNMGQKFGSNRCPLFTMLTKRNLSSASRSKCYKDKLSDHAKTQCFS